MISRIRSVFSVILFTLASAAPLASREQEHDAAVAVLARPLEEAAEVKLATAEEQDAASTAKQAEVAVSKSTDDDEDMPHHAPVTQSKRRYIARLIAKRALIECGAAVFKKVFVKKDIPCEKLDDIPLLHHHVPHALTAGLKKAVSSSNTYKAIAHAMGRTLGRAAAEQSEKAPQEKLTQKEKLTLLLSPLVIGKVLAAIIGACIEARLTPITSSPDSELTQKSLGVTLLKEVARTLAGLPISLAEQVVLVKAYTENKKLRAALGTIAFILPATRDVTGKFVVSCITNPRRYRNLMSELTLNAGLNMGATVGYEWVRTALLTSLPQWLAQRVGKTSKTTQKKAELYGKLGRDFLFEVLKAAHTGKPA